MTWAVRLPASEAAGVAALRFLAGAEACLAGDCLWLRGSELAEADELRLRQIPAAERYTVADDDALFPAGSRLPRGRLPAGEWQPLARFIVPQLPGMTTVEARLPQLALHLVRDDEIRPVAALLAPLAAWRDYALHAPQVRLTRLSFAASSSGQVLIVGTPLPPLAGPRYWETAGLYIAAGMHWSPAVDPPVLRAALRLSDGDLALWHSNGACELLRRSDFVAARRAAVRATAEGADVF